MPSAISRSIATPATPITSTNIINKLICIPNVTISKSIVNLANPDMISRPPLTPTYRRHPPARYL